MIRGILVVASFVLFFIFSLPILAFLFILRKFKPDTALYIAFRIIKAFLGWQLFISGTRLIIEGRENIPDDGEAVLFVGNHRSLYDAMVTYRCLKFPTGYVAKKSLAGIPIMGWWMDMIGSLFLDRQNVREGLKTILSAIDTIKRGTSVFIFPEGTRNRNEDQDVPMTFKEGSLKIAQKTGCKIIPVAIKDTELCYEANHGPKVTPQTVRVRLCEPVYIKDIPEEYKKEPAAYIREIIMNVNKEPIAE